MHFFGRNVALDMPAGCAIICPGADIALSLPSVKKYEKTDWLSECTPWLEPNFPADSIWPSNPPRGDLHAITQLYVIHSLTRQHGLIGEVCRQCGLHAAKRRIRMESSS